MAALLVLSVPFWIRELGGASDWRALDPDAVLSPAAREFLEDVLEPLRNAPVVDFHTHLAGVGDGSDSWVNPRMQSWLHPKDHVRFRIYRSAAGLDGEGEGALDLRYAERLLDVIEAEPLPVRHLILAFDHRYDHAGRIDLDHSEFHVPNEFMWDVVQRNPERLIPCISVHPYRGDALEQLTRWGKEGVRFVKWLPNAMGIDPASERCDAFYDRMVDFGMVLLTHTGEEQAVEAGADQELGNPLRLRRPLGRGVRVLAAHCASSGQSEDLDRPGKRTSSFELFLRLMDEPNSAGRLFGEISTVTQLNRFGTALETLLSRRDLHPRLVNGTDWPLPAVNVLFSTRALQRAGFLTASERELLNELYDYHPLAFDLALKRTVRAPQTGARFSAEAFQVPTELLGLIEAHK